MKKWSLLVLALCLMLGMMALNTPQAEAAITTHSHCVCGGHAEGVGNHKCENVEWTPLSAVVTDVKQVDWQNVPSGCYYLDEDIQTTSTSKDHGIGSAVKNDDGTYTAVSKQISLCLNGHNITTKGDRAFKGVFTGSTLNICDCAGEEKWGTITGGYSATGGIFYTYANSKVNLYGGNYTAKADQVAATGGGLFFIAQDRTPVGINTTDSQYASTVNIYDGNYFGGSTAKKGGNIHVTHCSILNVYGGCIYNGTAEESSGNIYRGGNAKVNIHGGEVYGGYPEVAKVITDGVASAECTLDKAIKNYESGSVIRLYRDLETELEITKDILLDLNGHNLSGVSGSFTCMDSAEKPGVLSCNGTVKAADGYVAMTAENGVSFYSYHVGITHLTIDPKNTAIGYKASVTGQAILEQVQEFGLEMWLEGYDHRQFGKSVGDGQLTLRLKNIMASDGGEMTINGNAFVVFDLQEKTVTSENYGTTMRQVLETVNDNFDSYIADQQNAVKAFVVKYADKMTEWSIDKIKA